MFPQDKDLYEFKLLTQSMEMGNKELSCCLEKKKETHGEEDRKEKTAGILFLFDTWLFLSLPLPPHPEGVCAPSHSHVWWERDSCCCSRREKGSEGVEPSGTQEVQRVFFAAGGKVELLESIKWDRLPPHTHSVCVFWLCVFLQGWSTLRRHRSELSALHEQFYLLNILNLNFDHHCLSVWVRLNHSHYFEKTDIYWKIYWSRE